MIRDLLLIALLVALVPSSWAFARRMLPGEGEWHPPLPCARPPPPPQEDYGNVTSRRSLHVFRELGIYLEWAENATRCEKFMNDSCSHNEAYGEFECGMIIPECLWQVYPPPDVPVDMDAITDECREFAALPPPPQEDTRQARRILEKLQHLLRTK